MLYKNIFFFYELADFFGEKIRREEKNKVLLYFLRADLRTKLCEAGEAAISIRKDTTSFYF
jgi:hypothetical protein